METITFLLALVAVALFIRLRRDLDKTREDLSRLRRDFERGPAAPPAIPVPTGIVTPAPPAPLREPVVQPPPPPRPSPRPPAAPKPPAGPSFLETALGWFQGEHGVLRIGLLVLFVGVALLVKYAADHSQYGPALRLTGGVVLGAGVFAWGWTQRHHRRVAALSLQGGGLGILYIAALASSRLLGYLPMAGALVTMTLLSAAIWTLAVRQNSSPLAALGTLGGFAAPLLLSDGGGHLNGLYAHYLILDLCLLGILFLRPWRSLGWMGLAFTLGVGAPLGILRHAPENFAALQLFLVAFFLVFWAMGWRLAKATGKVDGTLVFGSTVAACAIQGTLVQNHEHGLALSALAAGTFLATAAWIAHKRSGPVLRDLAVAWGTLGVSLLSLVIPFWFEPATAAVLWALEGAGAIWVGSRQNSTRSLVGGLLLQGVAAVLLGRAVVDAWPGGFLLPAVGGVALWAAGWTSSWMLERDARAWARSLALPMAIWGAFWFLVCAGLALHAPPLQHLTESVAWLAGLTAIAVVGRSVQSTRGWNAFAPTRRILSWLTILPALACLDESRTTLPWLATQAALLLVWMGVLRGTTRPWIAPFASRADSEMSLHLAWLAFLAGFGARQTNGMDTETGAAVFAGLALAWSVPLLWGPAGVAPFRNRFPDWSGTGYLAVAACLGATFFVLTFSPGALSGIPLASPTFLLQAAIAGAFWLWAGKSGPRQARYAALVLGAIAFHAELARAFHLLGAIPWDIDALWDCAGLQASVSLAWVAAAFGVMYRGSRTGRALLWQGGAAILGLTVAKLVFVDLSGAGTIGRIVAFLGVGLLMLAIGWTLPMPRKSTSMDG